MSTSLSLAVHPLCMILHLSAIISTKKLSFPQVHTGSFRLMQISLLRMLLLQFFKTITPDNFANAILLAIYFVSAKNLANAIFG